MISKIYTVTYIDLVAEGLGHMHKYLSRVVDVDDSMPQFKHPPPSKDMNSNALRLAMISLDCVIF